MKSLRNIPQNRVSNHVFLQAAPVLSRLRGGRHFSTLRLRCREKQEVLWGFDKAPEDYLQQLEVSPGGDGLGSQRCEERDREAA